LTLHGTAQKGSATYLAAWPSGYLALVGQDPNA